jgi:hypothetical protein
MNPIPMNFPSPPIIIIKLPFRRSIQITPFSVKWKCHFFPEGFKFCLTAQIYHVWWWLWFSWHQRGNCGGRIGVSCWNVLRFMLGSDVRHFIYSCYVCTVTQDHCVLELLLYKITVPEMYCIS